MMKIIEIHNKNNLPTIEYNKLIELQGDFKNRSKEQIEKLANSIKNYGFLFPAFIWKSKNKLYIIDAHGRKKALALLEIQGYTVPPIPYVEIPAKNKKEAVEKLLYLNSQYGSVNIGTSIFEDFEIKLEAMPDLELGDVEFDFSSEEADEDTAADEIPEVAEKECIIKTGDLIELGRHRVLCGDCTMGENVEELMNGEKADIVFTSPPYNIGKNIALASRGKTNNAYLSVDDNKTQKEYLNLLKKFTACFFGYCDYLLVNIQCLAGNKKSLIKYLYEHIDFLADISVWVKTNPQPAMASNVMNSSFEFVLFIGTSRNPKRAIKTANFRGTVSNVFHSPNNSENTISDKHKAAYPLAFCSFYIENFSQKTVIDSFLGTGTTLMAAEQTNRKCYGMEIEPRYCQVIIERYCRYANNYGIKINGRDVAWDKK